jgi:hypothetical protein
MDEQKSFVLEIAEAIDRRLRRRPSRDKESLDGKRGWRWLGRQMIPNIGTVLVVVILLLTVPSLAAPSQSPSATSTSTISYQGRLADSAGNPLTDKYNMEFRLYDVPTGGVPLWTEMWTGANAVDVSDGLFNVMLGSIDNTLALSIENHDELYLGITVGTDSEMAPRVQLGSVPFAMVAGQIGNRGSGLIQTWNNGTTVLDATGAQAVRVTFDTGIDVEVPGSTTQYYLVVYDGVFGYDYIERTGTLDSFYGDWAARLTDGETMLDASTIVKTGYRMKWDAVGGSTQHWNHPYSASWIVELTSGTHDLDIAIHGYSDGTMDHVRIRHQNLQVFPLP